MGNAVYKGLLPLVLIGVAVLAVGEWHGHPTPVLAPAAHPVSAQRSFANLPLAFEPNQGQNDPAVLFQSRMAGYSLYLTADEAVIGVRGAERPLRLAWQGAGSHPDVTGLDRLPGRHHYLKGNDPARWHRNIPTYGKVRYHDLYPGIDLVYYGRDRHLEYDLIVAPGADPKRIQLTLTGMDRLQVDHDGTVQVQLAQQRLSLSKPVIYQESAGGRQPVDGGYVRLADNRLGLRLGRYDATRPLIIDPVLSFSTYLGGTGAELAHGVAVDPSGNVYVVGETRSSDIAFSNNESKTTSDDDVLLAQFDSSGTLQAVVYLGGSGTDRGFGVAADGSAVYIVGDTTSTNFPVSNSAQQLTNKGNTDAFVAKLNSADLSSVYVTYLGGTQAEEALGVAVDGAGNAYVAGSTLSSDFPKTLGGVFNGGVSAACTDQTNATIPCSDAFVAKYDLSGNLVYATYLGGKLEDTANAIAVDSAGDVFVTGLAYSGMTGSFSSAFIGQPSDAFIAVLDGSGNFAHGIYIGGTGFDQGQAIAVDGSSNVYMAGITNSTDLPVTNAFQGSFKQGGLDGFVAKLHYDGASLQPFQTQYLTYLGGSPQSQTLLNNGQDQIYGIAADAGGNAYVVGETMSADFPQQLPLQTLWFGSGSNGWGDAFVTKFGASGNLAWSTLLGGSDDDWASGVALDPTGNGNIYVVGSTFSSDFPTTTNPYQAANRGGGDAFLFELTDNPALNADLKVGVSGAPDLAGTGETITYKMVVSNQSTLNNANGVVVRATLPAGVSYQSATPANSCTASGQQLTCQMGSIPTGGSATITVSAVNNTAGDITFTAQVVRAFQPDPTASNNTASVTTKAALGSSGGGGAWSPLAMTVLLIYGFGRRRWSHVLPH